MLFLVNLVLFSPLFLCSLFPEGLAKNSLSGTAVSSEK